MGTTAKISLSVFTTILLVGLGACSKTQNPEVAQDQTQTANPADGNLAPVSQAAPSAPAPNQQVSTAPATQNYPADQNYPAAPASDTYTEQPEAYAPQPPPPLPEYDQPPCPGDNYFWTPGYWNYATTGYYWVPGAWVLAPYVGALWTPPYWQYQNDQYVLVNGYWGPYIGFYGGINYGFGYTGHGYYGAYWNHGSVYYNRDVTNVNTTVVHNVYNYAAPHVSAARISYNGGHGGIEARPTAAERAALRAPHAPPVPAQVQHVREAAGNRAQFAAENHGKPQMVAAARPLPTAYKAPAARPPVEAAHPEAPRPAAPETRAQVQAPGRPAAENRVAESRPAPQQPTPQARPEPAARPSPAARPAPEARPTPAPRPEPAARPTPQARPEPAARPAPTPRPEARPVAAPRPEARPAPAPRPEARPAPRPEARPAPAPRPEARPAPAPRPEARPAPAPHPAPAAKPAGHPEEHKEH